MNVLRRCAALIAAYAVALQLVLSAFAAAAPPAAGIAICRGDSPVPAGDTAHDLCAACVAHCLSAAAPDRAAVALAWPAVAVAVGASFSSAAWRPIPNAREHAPRAPPLA
jgi:hypothetical protein